MKQNHKGGMLNLLSEEQVRRLHDAALSLLQDPGIQSESDLFLDSLRAGAHR